VARRIGRVCGGSSDANEAVRRYVMAHGDRPWTAVDLEQLSELRRLWLEAERGLARAA